MNTMKALITLAFILLVPSVLNQNLKIEDLSQFIAGDFTPRVFEGQSRRDANQAMKTIFSLSKQNLVKEAYSINSEVYDKIMDTIRQVSDFNSSEIYQKAKNLKILPSNTDLKSFGNETNSVVFYCGSKEHAMLCEIFKIASPDPKPEYLWKVLIYNSGDELEYHPEYHVGPRKQYSPVVIYEGPPFLINEAWVEAAMDYGSYEKVVTNFYPRLLGAFDRSNATYDVFIDRKRNGTCAFSSYRAYFTFKLTESICKKIFLVASLSGLQHFVSEESSDFVSQKYRTKYSISPSSKPNQSIEGQKGAENFIYKKLSSTRNILNEIEKFHFLRWNVDLVDTMFRYLVEIGNGVFETKEHVFFRDLKVAYDRFQIHKKKNTFNAVPKNIADNRPIRASFCSEINLFSKFGSHEKLSAKDTFYCDLPKFEYQDGAYGREEFWEFSNSIFYFLETETVYRPCFMDQEIPLISYLDSLTFRIMPMVDKFDSLDVHKMGFLYTFFTKTLRLLKYDNNLLMYQKVLILFEIFKTYKEIYARHLKASLNNDQYKFRLINDWIFERLSPYVYFNPIDLPERTLPAYVGSIEFRPEDTAITSKLVSILFKNSKDPPNPAEMRQFFQLNLINYHEEGIKYDKYLKDDKEYPKYDQAQLKRMAYILTVISNPISIENSNNTVLPEIFLLDRHYYNLLHMLCKITRNYGGLNIPRPNHPLYFGVYIGTKRHFNLKTDGYSNHKEIASISSKEKRPLELINLRHKFSSIFYFLTYLQEDHVFILSELGMEIIYTFILNPSIYIDNSAMALPPVIQYFLCWKDKILAEISTDKDDIQKLRLLANYEIILNHLMSIEKRDLDIGDLENVFVGQYQPIFAFLKLNTLILEEKFSNLTNSHDVYLSVISNFELIKSFFFKEEIEYVLKMYYDHWKFLSSKSRCAAQTEKGIQNLVNGNFLIDGERIELSGLPFPNHRLWKMMDVKDKRDYNIEFALYKRLSDGLIFSIFKHNDLNLAIHENDAFLLKNGEVIAILFSYSLNLCDEKMNKKVAFNSKMVGSDDGIIGFKTNSTDSDQKIIYLFDLHGSVFGVIYDENTLVLKNSSKFVGNVSSPFPCSFYINLFCSFASESQSLLHVFLIRGVLFNFAADSYIFILESEAQSFYFFNSYNGPIKDFYAMKEGSDEYFLFINGEKFKIHSPAGIEGNFFVSSNLPFLFVSIENSFHIIIPVPLSPPGDSYKFTFVNATCRDDHFNIEGHDREIDLAIAYWLVFLRYYDRAMQYVSLYTSISFQLTELELVIMRNILEINYRDLEYLVIKAWVNHLLDEHNIFFKGFLDETNRVEKITDIASLISVIPFKYKRVLFSFLPNIGEDKYLWAYSNKLKIDSSDGKSSKIQPNITDLKKAIQDADYKLSQDTNYKLSQDTFPRLELPICPSDFRYFRFRSGTSFLYDLAGSSKNLPDFTNRLNSHYLNSIRFYLSMEKNTPEYKIVSLFHVIFVVFNNFLDKEKLSTFISDLKKKKFPHEMLDIYEKHNGFQSPSSDESAEIVKTLPKPPADYENLLSITMKRKALSSDLFKANASFTLFSDAASLEEKLKSIVSTDELLYGFPLGALKDPRLLAQILLCGSVEELGAFFTVSAEKVPELLDLLWSHFITFFYCKSPRFKKSPFCQARVEKNEAFTENMHASGFLNIFKRKKIPTGPLPVIVQDKVFILIEFFTGFPLYEEQKTIISKILNETMHGNSYVVQQGMAGGKTTRFGPAAAILATSILRKLPIFVFPNSILNQNILQLRQWLFDFFGKGVFEFKAERSLYGYSESYLRHLYYRLTMAHHRGDAFVSSINSIQCLLNAIKELYLQNTDASKRSFVWVVRILYFIKYYSIFVGDEVDEIIDLSILYNFDTDELDEKNWSLINLLIECFLSLRDKKVFESQTGEKITIFEIKEPLTPSTVGPFKQILKKELNDILSKTSNETRALIVDNLFVNCWEKVRNVGYGASMKSPLPYPIPYSMANTPREGSSFGNQMFIIAISIKFYLENEMKDLSEPPLFFKNENMYSTLGLLGYDQVKEMKKTHKLSHLELFKYLRDKIYENPKNLVAFLRNVVIESLKTSPHQLVSSVIEVFLLCQFIGYSGTLHNWKNFEPMPNIRINVDQSSVIEKKIYYSFAFPPPNCYTKDYPEIYDYAAVTKGLGILKDHQFNTLMDFVFKNSTTALFDVGALLKDYSNSKVAQDILASKKYKCVVYYDDKQNVIVYQMNTGRVGRDLPVEGQFEFLQTKHNLKNDEIFLYLDQPHCFGTNVDVNNSSAICVVTFSTLVYTKSFYQALLRARKLLNGISDTIPLTPPNDARHQIRFFVSSFLKHDQAMLSALSQEERETLSSKPKIFPEDVPGDEKVTLQKIFTSAHLNQLRRDLKERNLLPSQVFFAKLFMTFLSPAYSADSSIPNWDRILSIKDKESIDELKWIFFSESMPEKKIKKFFEASEVGKALFENFNISSIPSDSNTPTLDRETVVQSTQEQESVQEQEQIHENLEDKNVSPAEKSPFGISDAIFDGLRVKFTKDFATTVVGRLNLNDAYTKYPVFVDAVDGKWLFATMNDVAENLRDIAHSFFSPALINIYDLEEFDLEDMLHYLAYSGGAVGFMDLLDSCTKADRDLIFGFIAAHELILQKWIYFAIKFKKLSSLRVLRRIKGQFKGIQKYDFKNVSIKTSISEGKLRLKIYEKDSEPLASERLSVNVKPENLSITNANLTAEESAYSNPEAKVRYESTMLKSTVICGFVLLCIGWSAYFLYSHYYGASKPSSIGISHYFLLISRTAKLTLVAAGVSITYGLWVAYQNHVNAEKRDSSSRSTTLASQDGNLEVLTSVEANAIKGERLSKIDGNSASARHTGLVWTVVSGILFVVLELL